MTSDGLASPRVTAQRIVCSSILLKLYKLNVVLPITKCLVPIYDTFYPPLFAAPPPTPSSPTHKYIVKNQQKCEWYLSFYNCRHDNRGEKSQTKYLKNSLCMCLQQGRAMVVLRCGKQNIVVDEQNNPSTASRRSPLDTPVDHLGVVAVLLMLPVPETK